MNEQNKAVNAGVNCSTGIEFQKHCVLHILFEKYHDLKDKKYFICLEHHDDFLFCYMTGDKFISSIDSYQAKKSSKPWTLGKNMYDLIKKMVEVGASLYADNSILKVKNYTHNLEFITNNSIILNNGKSGKNKRKTITINESNSKVKFTELDEEISNRIKSQIKKMLKDNTGELKELNNVSMGYIDFPKKSLDQKDCLVGEFNRIFGDRVNDPKAAVDALLLLFRDIENTLNQGNTATLVDQSKRISCDKINQTINIITTKKMAFNLWREEKKEICNKLNIAISKRATFELNFDNSFDRFKDLQQVEHIKIFGFVKDNSDIMNNFTNDVDCIQELYKKFKNNISSQLSELNIKAAIYAAYIEVREMLWGQN
ncbi:hypothetical protein [Clostridium sp. AWRP]|uniref:hypothetical protein n=1 Tax=Clostridium sp. AWRP TaxID=2212991 RepID=UPI000FD92B2D|nr:hypothetical protein [Clostridium sp. AWRP]AZV56768.1 hypothetical protein DMR38_09235 [Clostridium sp. AWRP]